MKIYNVAVVSVFFAVAVMACSAAFALDIDLATAGISVCDPGSSNQVYAARELEKHLNMISGRKGKARMTNGANAVFMIGTPAPGRGKAADFEALAAVKGGKVYFWGDDGRSAYKGEVPCGGSMFAVYAFLDKVLGVKWVYPGDDGKSIVGRRRFPSRKAGRTGSCRLCFRAECGARKLFQVKI